MIQKTFIPKPEQVTRQYYLIDAKDKILGKVATNAASILRGKHKKFFTPHLDTGDSVIIINAEKIRVTGKKLTDKIYQRYTGYPAGRRTIALGEFLKRKPTEVLRLAISRMISKGALGNQIRTRVRIYAGDKHPHLAQKPVALEIN